MVFLFACLFSFNLPAFTFAAGPATVNLGKAGDFVILAKTGISTTGTTGIVGDIGVSPVVATAITGFNLVLPADSSFSTSAQVIGKVFAPDYANPTPVKMTTAISDMETAYTDGMGRSLDAIVELGAGNIGGMTLAPGLYKWSTGVTIPTDVTLSGSASDVWIFQIAQNLNISSATKVILSGGAKPENIFWVVAGQTTIGTTAVFNGNILDQTAIVLNTGAVLNGRALAQTAVTLDSNAITIPSGNIPEVQPITSSSQNSSSGNGNSGSIVLPKANFFGQTVSAIISNLKAGSTGDFVKNLQEFLISQDTNNQALKNFGLDGKFGPITKTALMKWQLAHSLVVDGILGPKTKNKINELGL